MAYAALLSLAQILHQTLNRDYQYLILDEKKQIESLVEEVTFLQNCLSSQKLTQRMETRIRDAAYIAEDIIESRIIDRFLTVSAGREDTFKPRNLDEDLALFFGDDDYIESLIIDRILTKSAGGSKENILIRFDVIESWFVELSKVDSDFQSTSMVFEPSALLIAQLGGIKVPRMHGIRRLAKTRRFKAWFLDPSIFLDFRKQPRPDAICALEKLATYGTKMVIISDSSNPASTTMEKLKILGFDTSLFVGCITSEDLRADDAGFEQPGPSHIDVTSEGTKEDLRKSLFTTVAKSTTENAGPSSMVIKMYKSAMVMAGGVDAADCIAVGDRLDDIKGANAAGISSVFVDRYSFLRKLSARHDDATYMLPSFTW